MELNNILVVEDEVQIVEVIKAYLEKENYKVYYAYSGKEALGILEKVNIDFIILDLMLPDMLGEDICKMVRLKSQIPILMLTAKVKEEDKINGLSIGADDYLTKPFSPKELVARVRTILRRTDTSTVKADIIEFNKGDLIVNLRESIVKKNNVTLDLTPTEFKIISILSQNIGRVFSREDLVIKVLGYDYDGYDRTIDTHIKNIRRKVEDENNRYISTVYGVGYKFMGD